MNLGFQCKLGTLRDKIHKVSRADLQTNEIFDLELVFQNVVF